MLGEEIQIARNVKSEKGAAADIAEIFKENEVMLTKQMLKLMMKRKQEMRNTMKKSTKKPLPMKMQKTK
jgi:CxxC motif-containing protein